VTRIESYYNACIESHFRRVLAYIVFVVAQPIVDVVVLVVYPPFEVSPCGSAACPKAPSDVYPSPVASFQTEWQLLDCRLSVKNVGRRPNHLALVFTA
jgi:hypothetical protein